MKITKNVLFISKTTKTINQTVFYVYSFLDCESNLAFEVYSGQPIEDYEIIDQYTTLDLAFELVLTKNGWKLRGATL